MVHRAEASEAVEVVENDKGFAGVLDDVEVLEIILFWKMMGDVVGLRGVDGIRVSVESCFDCH